MSSDYLSCYVTIQRKVARIFVAMTILLTASQVLKCQSAEVPKWIAEGRQVTLNHRPKLNDPCDYKTYMHFTNMTNWLNGYDDIIGVTYEEHPLATATQKKYVDPKEICIVTDSAGNIDINEFDCLYDEILDPNRIRGYCVCGQRRNHIDLNDNRTFQGLKESTNSYEYLKHPELDKRLIMKPGGASGYKCVASRFGHCTLDEYKDQALYPGWHYTECEEGFLCRNLTIWNPIRKPVYNAYTGEWWGICLSQATVNGPDRIAKGGSAERFSNNLNFGVVGVIMIIEIMRITC